MMVNVDWKRYTPTIDESYMGMTELSKKRHAITIAQEI